MSAQPDLFAPSFFNTTALHGADLAIAQSVAAQQDARVLAIFRRYGPILSPSCVWRKLGGNDAILLTSVRRSITVLTKNGALVKTDEKRIGAYSRLEFCWRLA